MRIVSVVGIVVLGLAATRQAQAQWKFGPEINIGTNSIGFGIGGRAELSLAKLIPSVKGLTAIGSFDYYFPSGFNYWEINAGVGYHFQIQGAPIDPYAGAGLGIGHTSVSGCAVLGISCSATNVGLDLFAGTNFKPLGTVTPFAELHIDVRSGSALVLTGGVLF